MLCVISGLIVHWYEEQEQPIQMLPVHCRAILAGEILHLASVSLPQKLSRVS